MSLNPSLYRALDFTADHVGDLLLLVFAVAFVAGAVALVLTLV